jgi:hypothetical protein
MHAHTHQLLSLRDGEPLDAAVRAHIYACAECSRALQQLSQRRQSLRDLTAFAPPMIDFAAIQARAAVSHPSRLGVYRWQIAAAVLCLVAGWMALQRHQGSVLEPVAGELTPPASAVIDTTDHQQQQPVAQLVAQSRELDGLLQHLPPPRQVQRVSFAATVDRLEQRVQWIDMQLSAVPEISHARGSELEHQLWRERVNLMESLVKVRYAEALPQAF